MNPETKEKLCEQAGLVKAKAIDGAKKFKDITTATWKSGWKGKAICIGVAILVVVCFGTCFHEEKKAQVKTVDEIRKEWMDEFYKEVANPNSELRKDISQHIENAHLTVTVRNLRLVKIDIETLDGSNLVGQNKENLKTVSMLIRAEWTGWIDKGFTDLRINYDAVNERLTANIEYTTALLNLEDTAFWEALGTAIGVCLAM